MKKIASRVRPVGPRRSLVMMVKVPVAGRVKTRLAKNLGVGPATSFYRHAASGLAARLNNPRRWTLILAVTPDAQAHSPALPPGPKRMRQGAGDLGRRMQRVFDAIPNGPVVMIGSDVPCITQADIARAFGVLVGEEAVLGPSPDGGYWLIGLRRCPRRLRPFRNVRWSTSEARNGTLSNLAGNRVGFVREMIDIDTFDDWLAYSSQRGRRILPAT